MKIFIVVVLSICALGIGITLLVPRKAADFVDQDSIIITFNRNLKKLQPELIAFSGSLRESDITIDNENVQKWIKVDTSKDSGNIRISIEDSIPDDLESITFNIMLTGGARKQVTLKVSEPETDSESETDDVELGAEADDAGQETDSPDESDDDGVDPDTGEDQGPVADTEEETLPDREMDEDLSEEDSKTVVDSGQPAATDKEAPIESDREEDAGTEDINGDAEPVTQISKEPEPVTDTNDQPDIEIKPWPQPQGKIINTHFPGIKDPASFKLANGKTVFGQSRGIRVPFHVYEGKISRRSPMCVYEFSDKDPVAEIYALWELGGRFLLKKDGKFLTLGGTNASIGPEVERDIQKTNNPLALETNLKGEKVLDDFCEAMGVPSGSLSMVMPEKVWSALYQTVDKVAVDNK
ncbi:MAG: hypothetical protein GY941_24845, partial [Planctomycetes bacterium]|nr:hypothetical protein [Planctomycetota bacterium]